MTVRSVRGKNAELLSSFASYCIAHPKERFWQALRNWSGADYILWCSADAGAQDQDTFLWEGRCDVSAKTVTSS
jgi:hypothetical protein